MNLPDRDEEVLDSICLDVAKFRVENQSGPSLTIEEAAARLGLSQYLDFCRLFPDDD